MQFTKRLDRLAAVGGLYLTAACSTAVAGDCVPFTGPVRYVAEDGPERVALGDLDGDGDLDMAVSNYSSDVNVLLNNGDGTFADPILYDLGDTIDVALGDLDGDGDLDMAVANYSNTNVSVLLNDGDGSFVPLGNFGVGSRCRSLNIALGDLNADGFLDLVVPWDKWDSWGFFVGSGFSVLLNSGDSTFQSPTLFTMSGRPKNISVGDLDGDGDLDLAIALVGDAVSVFGNNGDGSFANSVDYAAGGSPYDVSLGDLDGDGDLDMAVANHDSDDTSVLLNNGDGSFAAQQRYAAGDQPQSVSLGDFDGDGDLDMVTANWGDPGDVSVLLNAGDGTFATQTRHDAGTHPNDVALGDLDDDGDLDMIVCDTGTNGSGQQFGDAISVLLNQWGSPCQLADFVSDCVLDFFDVQQFLSDFAAENLTADYTGDGMLDFFDVLTFLQLFSDGCP